MDWIGHKFLGNLIFTGNPTTISFDSESIKSVCIKQTITGIPCTYAVASKGDNDNVSSCTQFDPHGDGEKLWKDLIENGHLTEASVDEKVKGSNLKAIISVF